MKKLFCLVVALLAATTAFSQTPEEIMTRVDAELTAHENEGCSMQIDVKMPIIGTMPAKASGVSMTIRDIRFGNHVTEAMVTFRLSDYPGAIVKDLR